MTTQVIGSTFPDFTQWHSDEVALITNICNQINLAFPNSQNLLVSMTWFGPQFINSDYQKLADLKVNKIFFLASVDAPMLNREQLEEIVKQVEADEVFYLGNFETEHQFNFIATLLPKYFRQYTDQELLLKSVEHLYVNYNRKPRPHRVALVKQLLAEGLGNSGIITLGSDDENIYNNEPAPIITLGEKPEDYAREGNWGNGLKFSIPHDIHSLGNMSIWQNHFLNIVGETEFNAWDPMFITEKTWKPILGLRPFVINGQPQIYQYLRDNGFCTFDSYFPTTDIIEIIKYLSKLSKEDIYNLYYVMLPDLLKNRSRFAEFVLEQQNKINNLFK